MPSLILSTIAFFIAAYFIKRWAEEQDLPKGITLNVTIFTAALVIAYVVAWAVGHVTA